MDFHITLHFIQVCCNHQLRRLIFKAFKQSTETQREGKVVTDPSVTLQLGLKKAMWKTRWIQKLQEAVAKDLNQVRLQVLWEVVL